MSVTVNFGGIKRKISNQNVKRGQYAVANQAMADMDRFVPRKEGNLRTAVHVTSVGKILYEMPYAKRQFHINGTTYSTPGTGPRWDLKAKGMYMDSWKKAFLRGSGIN